MKFNYDRAVQVALFFAVLDLCLLVTGCTTAWVGEANSIITLLIPAIQAALAIMAGFGVGISPTVMTAVNTWAAEAEKDLVTVKGLIDQYNTATAAAQPGILTEIQALLGVVSSNLTALLPTIHVTDAATEAKIAAVIQAVAGEISALLALLPAVKGQVVSVEELEALIKSSGFKSAKAFKADFNVKAGYFGKQFQI